MKLKQRFIRGSYQVEVDNVDALDRMDTDDILYHLATSGNFHNELADWLDGAVDGGREAFARWLLGDEE